MTYTSHCKGLTYSITTVMNINTPANHFHCYSSHNLTLQDRGCILCFKAFLVVSILRFSSEGQVRHTEKHQCTTRLWFLGKPVKSTHRFIWPSSLALSCSSGSLTSPRKHTQQRQNIWDFSEASAEEWITSGGSEGSSTERFASQPAKCVLELLQPGRRGRKLMGWFHANLFDSHYFIHQQLMLLMSENYNQSIIND